MQQKNQPGNMSAQNNSPKTWLIFSARLPVKSSTKLLRVVWRWTTSCWRCLCRRGDACAVFPRAHSASEILRKTPKLNGKVNATRYRKSLFFGLCSHSRVLKYSVQVSWMDYQFLPFSSFQKIPPFRPFLIWFFKWATTKKLQWMLLPNHFPVLDSTSRCVLDCQISDFYDFIQLAMFLNPFACHHLPTFPETNTRTY